MVRINLLPHRQIRRAERQRQFNLMLACAAAAGVAIVFLGSTILGSKLDEQADRNARLEAASANLDKQIEEIRELKTQIRNVLDRKQIVENLQVNRSQSVMMLDEISRQLPEGMYLRALKQQGNLVTVEGVADTNARVATLVRNLSGSEWLQSPNLVEIKSATVNGIRQNNFTVNAQLKAPPSPEDGVSDMKKGGAQ
ncbi:MULTISPECIES: PilN domain-containing protein [Methylobacillus]|uniref:Fimbrial assembly n=1 Tax=Methylobacillus flagellatus (strain ATCC 51484 / DSM 6875 / VKM B-1610 / KT) TaxID=265072 RepID=Q1GYG2_METFK|nr:MULTISPECIES: PilN domain-containing protein [Methylobacillus]ABE50725.1 Fimbrial assembly [Methylobacillus flagellatus KT]MPS47672.1 fimbrial protein [Methylobacillus sp.]